VTGASTLARELRDAAQIVSRVATGKSLGGELDRMAEEGSASARGALIDLTHGTLRRYGRSQAVVRELSRRRRPDAPVEALLWCALYCLESGRYAPYTVVDQAVRACALLEKPGARGYVNAMLRRFVRERGALEARIAADPEALYQHPQWWIDIVRASYPGRWEDVLAAGNSHPPMCLRVNSRRTTTSEYRQELAASGIASRQVAEHALLLERPVPVERLPGFESGRVSVQDAGAQRAAQCLDLAPGQRVLDACAAPGGKAAHVLERCAIELTALDADAVRCARMERNLDRLQLRASIRAADCTQLASWWDGAAFDRVLADVPCSASGVARRHPDVKWLRRARDLPAFASRQSAILGALWRVLRPGGKLLYVTCSVFPQENDTVIDAFVAAAPDAQRIALPDAGPAQWLPDPVHDGFYYALIEKKT
jgi:16S rRNA (cytosine967-C5)-methyltransferase